MASYVTPKKNAAFVFYASLEDQANAGLFKASPTLAAGDFKVSIDGGALTNLTDLPTVTPSGGRMVKVTLTASEMNGDNITVVASDASGAEWYDLLVNIQTSAQQVDDLAAAATIGAAGAGLTALPWNAAWDAQVESEVADALEATIADSIPADGSMPSVKQALYMIAQRLTEAGIVGTTMTIYKPDGTTPLYTLTLGDATNPTTMTRAT